MIINVYTDRRTTQNYSSEPHKKLFSSLKNMPFVVVTWKVVPYAVAVVVVAVAVAVAVVVVVVVVVAVAVAVVVVAVVVVVGWWPHSWDCVWTCVACRSR